MVGIVVEADDDIHSTDRRTLRRLRQLGNADMIAGYVDELARILEEEVVMVGNIGVEIGSSGIDDDLAQEPGGYKLVQGV